MSDLTKPSPNISSLAALYPEGDFPSHIDVFGKGGFVVLNDDIGSDTPDDFINERITHQRRKEGMLVYISSDSSYYRCVVTGSNQSEGVWSRQYFSGRYFQGPSAPTASDLVLGEKWFNTTVGSEFTYLYTDENQDEFVWVDIDHLGQGETGFVRISGDTMTGTLTGINASFLGITASNGFIGTFTGTNASFIGITATNGFIGVLTGTDASFSTLTASNGFVGTLIGTDASFENAYRVNDSSNFLANEFITKQYHEENSTLNKNLLTNGNFLVWQRGRQFRYLSDTRLRNQTKKQIGFNYFNVEHNANFYTPKTYISGRFKSGNYNYGSMFSAAADRWVFGWQNIEDENTSAPVTGSGFYVYRGFVNPEDSQIIKNSKYFCRVSTSPPPSYSENRTETIYTSPTNIGSIQNLVNPTSPNGLTYGAIVNHLVSDDRPSELSGQTADLRRVTDTQYVSSYFDPYNTCIPITGDTDVHGIRAKLRDDYWAGFSQTISYEDFRSMDFGTENAKDLTLRFYARGNVPGEYYVTFTNAGPRTVGASQYPNRGRLYTKGFTIDEPNQWKLYQITCEGDKVNEPSSGLTGCWNYPNKNANWPGLQVNWCVGSAPTFQAPNSSWEEVSCGGNHTLAIRDDGSIWSWGRNSSYQLGIGTSSTSSRLSPQSITGGTWTSVSAGLAHSVAIKQDGTLWSWGDNVSGQLGLGIATNIDIAVPSLVSDQSWVSVSSGEFFTLAIKGDGSLWGWGSNLRGQLGLGTPPADVASPDQVGDDYDWASVSCGKDFTLAIKTDGTLWAWGENSLGQLGLGDALDRLSPTPVGEDDDWASVSCGRTHTLALKTDGSLYAWGQNVSGQLGVGNTTNYNTPQPVSGTWSKVSAGNSRSYGIKTDDTLWRWGAGFTPTEGVSSPVPVDSNSWKYISVGGVSIFGFKSGTDSPLWSWGVNSYGQLGQGDTETRTTPTLLTLLIIGGVPSGSWRYAGEGNVWGASGQANLLSATGNYLDIAEVSLVPSEYDGSQIYFPQSDSEIITECRKYFFGSKVYQSETTPVAIAEYGIFQGIGLKYFISTNEMTVAGMPDIVRWPHNGSLYSELFSVPIVDYDDRTVSVPLAETSFSRIFNCMGSAASSNVFPASNTTLPSDHRDDYNINNGTVNYLSPAGTYTTETVVQAIVTYNGSPFGPALRESLGWDSATTDMINYFKYPYGCRGFCSPRILNVTDNTRSRFTQLNRLAVQYSNISSTNEDVILSGRVWLDAEFAYGD